MSMFTAAKIALTLRLFVIALGFKDLSQLQ
jgi:hypothetical protein